MKLFVFLALVSVLVIFLTLLVKIDLEDVEILYEDFKIERNKRKVLKYFKDVQLYQNILHISHVPVNMFNVYKVHYIDRDGRTTYKTFCIDLDKKITSFKL